MTYEEIIDRIKVNVEKVKDNEEQRKEIEKQIEQVQNEIIGLEKLGEVGKSEVSRAKNKEANLNNTSLKLSNKSKNELALARKTIKEAEKEIVSEINECTEKLNLREDTIKRCKNQMLELKKNGKTKKYKATNAYVKKVIEEKKEIARNRTEKINNFKEIKPKLENLDLLLKDSNLEELEKEIESVQKTESTEKTKKEEEQKSEKTESTEKTKKEEQETEKTESTGNTKKEEQETEKAESTGNTKKEEQETEKTESTGNTKKEEEQETEKTEETENNKAEENRNPIKILFDAKKQLKILFDAKKQQYILKTKKGILLYESKEFNLNEILNSKEFKEFYGELSEKHNDLKRIDPFIAYIISKSGLENSEEMLEDYTNAMLNKNEEGKKLESLNIEYNMNGIYGRKYSSEMSSEIMQYANAHKENNIAAVEKNAFTKFLEKHDKVRGLWEKVTKIGAKEQLLLPEAPKGKTSSLKESITLSEEYKDTLNRINEIEDANHLKRFILTIKLRDLSDDEIYTLESIAQDKLDKLLDSENRTTEQQVEKGVEEKEPEEK